MKPGTTRASAPAKDQGEAADKVFPALLVERLALAGVRSIFA